MTTPSVRLRAKINLVLPTLTAPTRALLRHREAALRYSEWLVTNHAMQLVLLPLMDTALAQARSVGPDDAVAAGVASYLEAHIEEERHGGGGLGGAIRDDLAVLGHDPDDVLARPLPDPLATLAGHLYYLVVNRHPVALLGHLEVLEGYAPTEPVVEALIARTGLPRAAFGQMLEHVKVDPQHRDDLNAVLDALPLTPEHETLLGAAALQTVRLLSSAFATVVADTGPPRALQPT